MNETPYYSYADALDEFIEDAEKPSSGIGTGWSVDEECGLMSRGELALLWARSSAGKSSVLLNVLANTPQVPTVFFNMEMRARSMVEWLTTIRGGLSVEYTALKGVLSKGDEDPRYAEVRAELDKAKDDAPLAWFVEPRGPSVDDLARTVDQITADTGIRPVRVMVDHLSLMYGARDYEGVSRMGEHLHQWAQDDDLAVICAQQTGRGGNEAGQRNDGHLPVTLSSGLYAGEHDADWIYGVWRPERNPKYRKAAADYKNADDFRQAQQELDRVRGMTVFAVIKNRPNGVLCEEGITLFWNWSTRRLEEY